MAATEKTPAIPVLILKEGTTRTRGREAQRTNIMVARAIAEAIKTTLGPKGMQKMLVDSFGDVVITSDGATLMKEIEVEHPIAKMLVEVAKAQDMEAGDGTTSAVILAGELLKNADELLDMNIHPTIIVEGYRKAAEKAIESIDKHSKEVKWNDKDTLKQVAVISMGTKSAYIAKEMLADIAAEAVLSVAEERDGKIRVDIDDIKVEKKEGKSIFDTRLVRGVVIDKEVVHPEMPKRIKNAKIALIEAPLEIEKLEFDSKLHITTPEQMKEFKEQERQLLKEMVDKIKSVGASVVFCQKGIDDVAQYFLKEAGILAVRRVKKSDMEKLAKATGGRIVSNIKDLTEEDLGHAELVEERKVGEDKMTFVEGCRNPKSVTILVRGGTKQIVDEAERTLHDALCVIRNVVEDGRIVAGGGAIEMEIARDVEEFANTLSGREQIVVKRFAEAIKAIPKILIENAGGDTVTLMAELVKRHSEGEETAGFDPFSGEIRDMMELKVIESARVKKQIVKSASEAAETILRIDDIIAAERLKTKEKGEKSGET